jgi:hypothetical protein
MEIFEIGGISLQLTGSNREDEAWIEAWYELSNGNCVTEKFIVLETGQPNYQLISQALELFGKQVLDATISATQMSPAFSNRYLFPAIIRQQEQIRWN